MSEFPAITLWQPWASLIAIGAKPYEFRRWPAPRRLIGRRVAIHAAARTVHRGEVAELLMRLDKSVDDGGFGAGLIVEPTRELLERVHTSPGILPLSAVLCTAILGRPERATTLFVDQIDHIDPEMWAWPLSEIAVLVPARPASGAQGWWTWKGEV